MNWKTFLCTSPPQPKLREPSHALSSKSISKARETANKQQQQQQLSQQCSLHKKTLYQMKSVSSISELFVKEARSQNAQGLYMKEVRDVVVEMRDMQREQLECSRRMVRLLEQKAGAMKQRNSVKKKGDYHLGLQREMSSKFKQFDRLKKDLTLMLKKSRSSQKTHKKSHSIVHLLR